MSRMVRTAQSIMSSSYIKGTLWTLIWCAACLLVFRGIFFSGFDQLPADQLDGRLIVRLYEHWFRVLSGRADWLNLGMFHPVENSLGFSVTFVLHAITYCFFRLLGFDIYHSAILNLVALSFIGYSGFWILARKVFRFTFGMSVLLSAFFVILSPVNIGTVYSHLQNYSVWYLPWLAYCFYKTFEGCSLGLPIRSKWLALSLIGFFSALYDSFYIPWFFAIYLFLFLLVGVPVAFALGKDFCSRWGKIILSVFLSSSRKGSVWIALGLGGSVLVPFFVTYLPVLRESGGHDFEMVRHSLPAWDQLVNVTSFSLLWGWVGELGILPNVSVGMAYGLPVLSMIVTVSAFVYCIFFYRSEEVGARSRWMVASLAVSVFAFAVVTLRWGDFSLWKIVYEAVPGGSAVRVVARFSSVLCLPILLAWGIAGERLISSVRISKWWQVVGFLALSVLVLEQVIVAPKRGEWGFSRSRILDWKAGIGEAPVGMSTFFVEPYGRDGGPWHLRAQLDAWAIAQDRDLNTINGYSGILPRGFELLGSYGAFGLSGYLYRVRDWLIRRDVTGEIGKLDLESGTWVRYDSVVDLFDFRKLSVGQDVEFGRNGFASNSINLYDILGYGWSWPESESTWTDWRKAELFFELEDYVDKGSYRLEFLASAFLGGGVSEQTFKVYLNEVELDSFIVDPSMQWSWISVDVPPFADRNEEWRIRIECLNATAPSSVSSNPDSRLLGLWLKTFRVRLWEEASK